MKITKRQLKALIREQVAGVLDETEWRDVFDQRNYFDPHSQNIDNTEASMTPNEEVQAELAISSAIDILHGLGYSEKDLMDLVKDLIPRASGDHPSWEDDASHPDSPDYEEEEGIVDLTGQTPTRQSIDSLKRRMRNPKEPVDIGMVDPRTGKVRVSESSLEDMIRVIIEEESELLEKRKKKSKAKRTAKGNVTQAAREKYATVGKDKFPIFDKKSAEAAIDLRGHTSKKNQKKIINKAAKYAPAAAKKAREVEKKK